MQEVIQTFRQSGIMAKQNSHTGRAIFREGVACFCLLALLLSASTVFASTPPPEGTEPEALEPVADHSHILPDLEWEKMHDPAPIAKVAPYPPLPPNAVMGQFSKTIDHYSSNPEVPEWLSPYLSMRLRGKGTLRAYGFARGDWSMASRRFQDIQFPQWVLPNDPKFLVGPKLVPVTTDNGFNYDLYAKTTRLGLEYFHQPSGLLEGGRTWARVETDFLNNQSDTSNSANQTSRPLLRLRLAYIGIGKGDWDLVVGQDWDIFSPLLPIVEQGTQMAYAGNTGDRRPCAYVNYDHAFGNGWRIQFQNGICLANGIDQADYNGDGQRGNSEYGLPGYQTRLGFVIPTDVEHQPVMFGVSGVMADDYVGTGVGLRQARTFPQRGIAADLRLPFTDRLTFQGEAYAGYNLNEFRAGIGQGINAIEGKVIQSAGGWGELVLRTCEFHRGSLGMGLDKADGSDVPEFGRTRNLVYWARSEFLLDPSVILGAEYYYWGTQWKGYNPGTASLVNLFAQMNF
jgi:hypothetical protein